MHKLRMLNVLIILGWLLGVSLLTSGVQAAPPKVTICHLPPGNPANYQTIEVSDAAVRSHLAHGDRTGSCEVAAVCPCSGQSNFSGDPFWNESFVPTRCWDQGNCVNGTSNCFTYLGIGSAQPGEFYEAGEGASLYAGQIPNYGLGGASCYIDLSRPDGVPIQLSPEELNACRQQLRTLAAAAGITCQFWPY